jgi:hypothetical protein
MRRAFIIKNDWLKFAKGISQTAYETTDDQCVYNQLEHFLANPPSGRPTKFISQGKKATSQNLFQYFESKMTITSSGHNTWSEDGGNTYFEDFDIKSGVTTEMIEKLCRDIGRSMYAYDENSKCFKSYVANSTKYCPIVFYKYQGHCYIIDDKSTIKSMSECNKPASSKKIIATTINETNQKKECDLSVFHIEKLDIENAQQLPTGIYLLQQSNINDETLLYISKYGDLPKTKNSGNVIVKIQYKNEMGECVIIACDANYGNNIKYESIKQVANNNGQQYINEGLGSVIIDILERRKTANTLVMKKKTI